MSTVPPSGDAPFQPDAGAPSYKDANAQAKAAKAYAKAQRPWYKKKRYVVPLGFVVLGVAVSAGSNGGGSQSASSPSAITQSAKSSGANSSTANNGSATSSDAETTGKVGEAVTNAGTTYEVTHVVNTDTIGDPDLLGARADGTFVVVSLKLTNNKNETKTFLDSSAHIQTTDGNSYQPSSKAEIAFGDDSLMLKDIQPDLTTRGKIAFELPPSKVSGSTLVIQDLFGRGDVKVDLGL
jgi:hypothetical protein